MNLQRLGCVVAVDSYRHFGKAAEKCLMTHKDFGNRNLTAMLAKEILQVIPGRMKKTAKRPIIQVQPAK